MPENLFRDCKLPLCRNTVSLHTGVMETDKRNTSMKEWGSTGWCTFPEILVTALPVTKKKKRKGGKAAEGNVWVISCPNLNTLSQNCLHYKQKSLRYPFLSSEMVPTIYHEKGPQHGSWFSAHPAVTFRSGLITRDLSTDLSIQKEIEKHRKGCVNHS